MVFIPGMQRFFNIRKSISVIHHINKLKNKNHRVNSIDAEKASDKIQHPFMTKNLQKVGIERTYLNIIKVIYDKTTARVVLNSKKLKAFPLRSGTRQGCPLSPLLFNIVLEVLAIGNQKRKRKKRNPNRKRSKAVTVCRWHDTIHRKSWRCYQKTTTAHEWIQYSCRIQNQYTEISFLYTNNKRSEREIKETTPITITSKRIRYLGINLPKEAKDL